MSFCSYSKDAAMFDSTPIENMFLLEYMPDAPEGYVRVYLYVRMLCAHPELGGDPAEVAQALRMEEDAVLDALQYWEQQGLVEKLSDRPASYQVKPVHSGVTAQRQIDMELYKYMEFNNSLKALFGEDEKLDPKDYARANDWLSDLGFTEAAALKLVEYELRLPGGRKPASVLKRADERAIQWAERGIHTVEDVQRAIAGEQRIYDVAAAVLRQFSIRRAPTRNELDDVRRWLDDWKLTLDDVLEACAGTTNSRNPSVGYLDAILRDRVAKGSVHFGAVKELLRELGAIGAKPTPEQMLEYGAWLDRGFEPEVIRLAAVQCAKKNRGSFQDLEQRLQDWDAAGIHHQAEVEAARRKLGELSKLLKPAGVNYQPGLDDLPLTEGWKAHSPELIRCAAELARGKQSPLKYMDSVLSNWAAAGISTPEAARAQAQHRAAPDRSAPRANQNYQQHEYKEEDFDRNFYYDPAKDYPEEAKQQ